MLGASKQLQENLAFLGFSGLRSPFDCDRCELESPLNTTNSDSPLQLLSPHSLQAQLSCQMWQCRKCQLALM